MSGGTIKPNGIIGLKNGSTQTFTIIANNGYHVADVLVNGSSVGAVTTYTVLNIPRATNISAIFAPDSTPTPTSAPRPNVNPTQQPTNTPTQTISTELSPTPTVPEFPALIIVSVLILMTMFALIRKKGKSIKNG